MFAGSAPHLRYAEGESCIQQQGLIKFKFFGREADGWNLFRRTAENAQVGHRRDFKRIVIVGLEIPARMEQNQHILAMLSFHAGISFSKIEISSHQMLLLYPYRHTCLRAPC